MAKEKPQNQDANPSAQELNKIDAIRDIIFGQNMQSYEAEFADVRDQINATKKELDKKREEMHASLLDAIDKMNKNLTQLINDNHEKTRQEIARIDHEKTNREDLGSFLVELGNKLINGK